jgi:hypothetical protein
MADVTYIVRTKYVAEDAASGPILRVGQAAEKSGRDLNAFKSAAAGIGSLMDGAAKAMLAFGAAGAAIGAGGFIAAMKSGLVDVNAKLEDTTNSFATIFNTLGASASFAGGLDMAKDLIGKIREDAAALPGEFQDFVGVAQTLSAPLAKMGLGVEEIREATKGAVLLSAGVYADQAGGIATGGREIAELLRGRAGGHNRLGTTLGITVDTMVDGKKWNEASDAARYKALLGYLEKAKDGTKTYERSWSSMVGTLTSNTRALFGRATEPLFEKIKDGLVRTNGLLSSSKLTHIADDIGKGLVYAYEQAAKMALFVGDHWGEIRASGVRFVDRLESAFVRIQPIAENIARLMGNALQDPGGTLGTLVALRAGLALPSIASGVGGAIGGAGVAGAAVLAPAAIAAAGALDVLTMNTKETGGMLGFLGEWGQGVWRDVKENFGKLITEVSATGKELVTIFRPIIDTMGVALLGALDLVVIGFRLLNGAVQDLVDGLHKTATFLGVDQALGWTRKTSMGDEIQGKRPMWEPKAVDTSKLDRELANIDAQAALAKAAEKSLKGSGRVQVNVNAPLQLLSDADPERLAKKVATHISSEIRNARTAASLGGLRHS